MLHENAAVRVVAAIACQRQIATVLVSLLILGLHFYLRSALLCRCVAVAVVVIFRLVVAVVVILVAKRSLLSVSLVNLQLLFGTAVAGWLLLK